jgi:hypothetical protein
VVHIGRAVGPLIGARQRRGASCSWKRAIREQLLKEDYLNAEAVRGTALVGRLKTMITAARMTTPV